jgi:hypothetical protein
MISVSYCVPFRKYIDFITSICILCTKICRISFSLTCTSPLKNTFDMELVFFFLKKIYNPAGKDTDQIPQNIAEHNS